MAPMVRQLFGESQGGTDEAGDTLRQRVIAALHMLGFLGVLRDGLVWRYRHHPRIDSRLIGRECRLLTVDCRNIGPPLLRTVVAAVSRGERHDWPRLRVHRDPDPWFVRLLLHEAPHRVRFHLKTPDEPIPGSRYGQHMQMVRQRRKADSPQTHEPSETDANRAAHAMEGDVRTAEAVPQYPLLRSEHMVCSVQDTRSTTGFALMVLLPSVPMTIPLVALRTTCWTRLSHDPSALLPP
jgi:hypothetical protein